MFLTLKALKVLPAILIRGRYNTAQEIKSMKYDYDDNFGHGTSGIINNVMS